MPNDTVKIFIGHSTKEFKDNILNLKEFLEELSSSFNASVKVHICEELTVSGQDEINEKWIKPSDIAFFCFKDKVGDFSKEELEVAVEEYIKNKFHPQVFVYIKQGNTEDSKLQEIIEKLEKNYRIFYFDFDEYAIKLRFAQNVSQSLGGEGKVKAEGRKVFIDDKPINLPVKELSAIKKNDNYNALQAEIKNLRNLRNEAEEDGDQEKYYELSEKINAKIAEQIQLEKDALKIYEYLNNQLKKDNADEDAIKALALATQGKIEEGLALLPIGQLLEQSKTNVKAFNIGKQLTENAKENAQKLIEKLLARIEILTLKINNDGVLKEICDLYEEILNQEEIIGDYVYALSYAEFLGIHNFEEKAYEIAINYAKKIENLKMEEETAYKTKLASSYRAVSKYCKQLSKSDESIDCILKAIPIYEELAKNGSNDYKLNVALSYGEYAYVLSSKSRISEAEEYNSKAIEILRDLVYEDKEKYNPYLGELYISIATAMGMDVKLNTSTHRLNDAMKIYEELIKTDRQKYSVILARVYSFLATRYYQQEYFQDALNYNLKAIELFEECLKVDKESVRSDVAYCYVNMALIYLSEDFNDLEKALDFALKAKEAYKSLCDVSYIANAGNLATTYSWISTIYNRLEDFAQAEGYLFKAIQIQEQLVKLDKEVNIGSLVTLYGLLGELYRLQSRYDDAEKYYILAKENIMNLLEKDKETYLSQVSRICKKLALLYYTTNRIDEAVALIPYFLTVNIGADADKSMEFILEDFSALYELLDTYSVIISIYEKKLEREENEEMYLSIIEMIKVLYELDSDSFLSKYVEYHYKLANFYKSQENYEKEAEILEKAKNLKG